MQFSFIDGGVAAAEGFTASGVLNKIKASRTTYDTALIYSDTICNAAGVFTQNRVKAECVKFTKKQIENGKAQAVIMNSGNANACTGSEGYENARKEAKAVSEKLNVSENDVLVCSTGVIGQQLPVQKILDGLDESVAKLSKTGNVEARQAIMTTDTKYKEVALETVIGGKKVKMGTMAKGSGMIHINLGTMLSVVTTDAAISSEMLEKALRISVAGTYNCVSGDGDTSTNDTLLILANGKAGNAEITSEGAAFDEFVEALNTLNTQIRGLQGIQGASTSRLSSNPKQAKYLLSVERQQKVKEALYLFLLQKREENELSQAFTAYNTRVVTSPTGEMKPTSPDRKRILLAAILVALLVPVIIIYIRENMNTKVRGRKDIEKLTIPFVGEIPLYARPKSKWPWKRWFKKKKDDAEEYKIVVKPKSRNVINEAFRVVRTNMEFMSGANHANKVIMITSVNPGSGKTFLCMNIATSFAIKEKKVICVDLDMRRASLSDYVGQPKTGISDYLNGKVTDWRDVKVAVEGYEHLEIIPVGTVPPNPAELLFSPRLQQMLDDLRKEYDLIFIDCPPVEIVADASVIAKFADMTVFVIRAGLMEREMLPVVEGYYNDKKFQNMSMLLNGTTAAGSRYGYHRYGYHYGYAYGYGGGYLWRVHEE